MHNIIIMVAEVVRAGRLPGFQITHMNGLLCSASKPNETRNE